MAIHTTSHDDQEPVVDGERQWAVYRCAHGCLHLAIDRVMLTLTEEEFHALQELMRRACDRFHRQDLMRASASAAH